VRLQQDHPDGGSAPQVQQSIEDRRGRTRLRHRRQLADPADGQPDGVEFGHRAAGRVHHDRVDAVAVDRDHMTLGRVLAERRRQVDAVRERHLQAERVHERVHLGRLGFGPEGRPRPGGRILGGRVRPRAQQIAGVLVVGLVGVEREQEALVGDVHRLPTLAAHLLLGTGGHHGLVAGQQVLDLAGAEVEHPHPVVVGRLGRQVVEQVEIVPERRERLRLEAARQLEATPLALGADDDDRGAGPTVRQVRRRRLAGHVGQRHHVRLGRDHPGLPDTADLGPEQLRAARPGDLHRGPAGARLPHDVRGAVPRGDAGPWTDHHPPQVGVHQREPGGGAHQQQVARAGADLLGQRRLAVAGGQPTHQRGGRHDTGQAEHVTTSHVDAIRRAGSRFPDF
jgi:hypothetical protein